MRASPGQLGMGSLYWIQTRKPRFRVFRFCLTPMFVTKITLNTLDLV